MNIYKVIIAFFVAVFCLTVSPAQARFLQADPIGYQDDLDLYTYVHNDPTDKIDPSGKQPTFTLEGAEALDRDLQNSPDQLDAAGTALQAVGAVP